jgi:hypothetical protein
MKRSCPTSASDQSSKRVLVKAIDIISTLPAWTDKKNRQAAITSMNMFPTVQNAIGRGLNWPIVGLELAMQLISREEKHHRQADINCTLHECRFDVNMFVKNNVPPSIAEMLHVAAVDCVNKNPATARVAVYKLLTRLFPPFCVFQFDHHDDPLFVPNSNGEFHRCQRDSSGILQIIRVASCEVEDSEEIVLLVGALDGVVQPEDGLEAGLPIAVAEDAIDGVPIVVAEDVGEAEVVEDGVHIVVAGDAANEELLGVVDIAEVVPQNQIS